MLRLRPTPTRRASALALAAILVLAGACAREEDPLREIRELHARGRYAATVDELRRLVDEDPTRAEANLLLGVALLRTGDSALAVWPLRKASEAPEHAVEAGLLLAQAMLENRPGPDSVTAIDAVLAIEPENVGALALRVRANMATGRSEEALADSDRVLELDPENIAVLVPRVLALIALERIDEAETELQLARERIESTDQEVEENTRARLCIAEGLFAFEKGDREAAESHYAECVEAHPTDRLAVSEAVAFYQRIGQPERATEILERALAETGSAFFRVALARRMGALGQADEERRLLREEAEERPSAASWFALADFHVQRDEFDAGLEAFEQALAAEPNPSAMLRFAYADTLVQAERYDEARRVAERLPQPELRSLIRGRILLGQGDVLAALAAFEEGIRLWPNNASARFLAGQAAERAGLFGRAASSYREALRAGAGQTDAGLALARLHVLHGDPEGALDALRRYVQARPRDPEGIVLSIRVAHEAGRHDIAAQGLERLGQLPGQAAAAVAEEASLLAAGRGPKLAIEGVERSGLDLTDPANEAALRILLEQLAALGEHARAQELVRSALRASPEEAAFHVLQARALHAAGAPSEQVRAAFERALELDPERAQALAGLAALEAAAGEREAALVLYDRAAAADPDDPAPERAAARLRLDAGEAEDAELRLERLLDRHPREAAAALELARLLEERGELDRALDFARRAAWCGEPEAEETVARIRERRAAQGAGDEAASSG
jgi:tetratricopeptide (TPR) repeat protein